MPAVSHLQMLRSEAQPNENLPLNVGLRRFLLLDLDLTPPCPDPSPSKHTEFQYAWAKLPIVGSIISHIITTIIDYCYHC